MNLKQVTEQLNLYLQVNSYRIEWQPGDSWIRIYRQRVPKFFYGAIPTTIGEYPSSQLIEYLEPFDYKIAYSPPLTLGHQSLEESFVEFVVGLLRANGIME